MRKLPKLTRKSDYFNKKWVVTLPPWSPWVLAGALIVSSVAAGMQELITAISLVVTLFSVIFCRIAWLHLKEMRYALHNALNDIENEELEEPEDPHLYEVPSA